MVIIMLSVSILERPGEGFAAQVAAALPEVAVMHGSAGDVVIVSPRYSGTVAPRRGAVLVPQGRAAEQSRITALGATAERVVTYGMAPDATLTLSSIGERTAMLAVQRELRNAHGDAVEPQELRVPIVGRDDRGAPLIPNASHTAPNTIDHVEATLAAAGASIMLGLNASATS